MDAILEWLMRNQIALRWMVAISIASAVGTVVLVPVMVARVRPDYFVTRTPPPDAWSTRHPVVRAVARALKNALGAALLLSGVWMLILPGQGLLTILVGLMLLDFPGKRGIEFTLVSRPRVLGALNWIRRRAGRQPLRIHEE